MKMRGPALRGLGADSPVFAVADQLVMVGGNFLLTVMVARAGSVQEFADFSVSYAMVVLLALLHGPLINEPLVLIQNRIMTGGGDRISANGIVSAMFLPLGALIGAAASVIGEGVSLTTVGLITLAGWLSALYWTAKSALHARRAHRTAFAASSCASATLLSAAAVGVWLDLPPLPMAFAAIALSAAVGTLCGRLAPHMSSRRLHLHDVTAAARIGIPTALAVWAAGNSVVLMLGVIQDPDAAAGLRAVISLLLPVNQVLIGLSAFLLPRMVTAAHDDAAARTMMLRILAGALMVSIVFGCAMALLAGDLLVTLFGPPYAAYASWLQLAALTLPACWVVVSVLRTWFRGRADGVGLLRVYAKALLLSMPVAFALLKSGWAAAVPLAFISIQVTLAVASGAAFIRSRD